MNRIPQMASVSDLKNRHLEVLAKLEQGPVLLASRNQPTAVLLSPELWNEIVDILEDYEDLMIIQERTAEAATHPEVMRPISELRAKLQEEGLLDVDPQ
jgi:PHD/YefM family antitoxin component YafN of YafNO toxin-antitoxin module